MEVRSYNCELGISNILFKRTFSNIQIEQTDANGNKKLRTVTCQFGQRSRILKSWQNAERRAQMRLPMILINRTGYQRDPARLNNLHNEVKYEVTSKYRLADWLTPVPISISYEVTIIARYPSDIDQIASNFMVFFNSSIYVSCAHPKYDGVKMNNQIVMEDSVNEDHPDELDGTTDDLVTSTFNFTFKTFLFAGMKQAQKRPAQILSTYVSSFVSSDILVIAPDQIDDFQKHHPDAFVSATLTSNVTSEMTSYVDSPNISDDVYEDFAPIIKRIEVGLYPTPQMSSFEQYMEKVDSEYEDITYSTLGYISSSSYTPLYKDVVDEDGNKTQVLCALQPDNMHYDKVDTYETIAPYVNRLIWKIDDVSQYEFADNVKPYRRFQV